MLKLHKKASVLSTIFIVLLLYINIHPSEINQYVSNDISKVTLDDYSICDDKFERNRRFSSSFSFNFEEKPVSILFNIQSTFTCSGNMNYEDGWRYRTCLFKNICYNKQNKVFLFYKSPNTTKIPILFEPKYGHLYDFNYHSHGFVSLVTNGLPEESWAPIIVNEILPNKTEAIYLDRVHTLFMHQNISYNSAHFIWEDIGTNFFSMMRMGVYSPNAVLIEYKNFPSNNSIFHQMYNLIIPAIASKVVDFTQYMTHFSFNNICFRTLVVGGSTPMFSSNAEAFNHGKEKLFYEYRNRILRYHNINLSKLPREPRVILVKKSRYIIKNLADIVYYIRTINANIHIDYIDWDQIPFHRQLHMLYNTTLLISPTDSISSVIPFLPEGASAIILTDPQSDLMNISIWNYFPHVRKLYYQISHTNDYIVNIPNSDIVTIIIKIHLLKELIDTVLDIWK